MTVGIILARKGREVVTIDLSATLGDAVRLLAEKRIGDQALWIRSIMEVQRA